MPENPEHRGDGSPQASAAALLDPLGAALLRLPEAERFRLLGSFFLTFAGRHEAAAPVATPETEALAKKNQRLAEEKALLEDALAAAQSDLARRVKQLEAEQQRSAELERILTDQRTRHQGVQKEMGELEEQLVAKNRLLHEAESELESVKLKLQRVELKAGDTSRVEQLEEGKRGLGVEIERLRSELETRRSECDTLRAELADARGAAPTGPAAGPVLANCWDRLARAKPPLAPGAVEPTPPAAERLFDAFIELSRFVSDFDQALRPFLGSFAKHNPTLARPWDVYARSPALLDAVREVIDIAHGKPPGVLKMRLLSLQRWALAAVIAGDTAIECVAGDLEEQLRGQQGLAADPNRKIKDYLKDDGHHLFQERIRAVRGQKLAEAYTHAQGG